jgi:PAS domain S-box-containing protein
MDLGCPVQIKLRPALRIHEMELNNKTTVKTFANPVILALIILSSIFLTEALVMFVLSFFSPTSVLKEVFLDAWLLSLILIPVIYYFVYKPFTSQIEVLKLSEKALMSTIGSLKRSEEALQMSEERYRSIVETTDDSIYLVDKNYRYLFMNRKHMKRMGFSDGEYTGRCFSEFHSDAETRDFIEKVDTVFEGDKCIRHGHPSERDKSHFLRTFSPVHDPDGKIVAVSVVSKKISPT